MKGLDEIEEFSPLKVYVERRVSSVQTSPEKNSRAFSGNAGDNLLESVCVTAPLQLPGEPTLQRELSQRSFSRPEAISPERLSVMQPRMNSWPDMGQRDRLHREQSSSDTRHFELCQAQLRGIPENPRRDFQLQRSFERCAPDLLWQATLEEQYDMRPASREGTQSLPIPMPSTHS